MGEDNFFERDWRVLERSDQIPTAEIMKVFRVQRMRARTNWRRMRAGQLAPTVGVAIKSQFEILGETKMPSFCRHGRNRRHLKVKIASDRLELTKIVRPTCLFAFLAPRPHEDCPIVRGSGARCDSVAINWIRQLPNDYDDG